MLHKIALLTLAPLALYAQAGVTFTYQISGANGVGPLVSGGTIVYPAVATGSASLATIYCANQSPSSYTLSAAVNDPLFAVSPASAQLAAGTSNAVGVTFTPKAAGPAAATISLVLTTAAGGSQGVRFALSAQAVDGVLASVATASDGNQVLLADGGTIAFPATAPSSLSSATFTISHRTTANISIDALLLSGTAFRFSGLPLMPVALAPGSQMSVGIAFSPGQPGSFSGTLTYSVSGVAHRILLAGLAATASLEFEISTGTAQAIQPGDTIPFPSVAVGTPTVLGVRVRNTGTAPAQISTLNASPSSFQFQNAPALPLSIAAGGSATLGLAFVPQIPGNTSGALRIGDASFVLSGVGLGSKISCMVAAPGQAPTACDGTTITLPSTAIGDRLQFTVQIANTGNQPGTIQNFAIGGSGFFLCAGALLFGTLAPGDSILVNASFAPPVLGITGGFLQINGLTTDRKSTRLNSS